MRTGFLDDAVRIQRLLSEQAPSWMEPRVSTVGAVALHINSNEHTDSEDSRSWVYFDAGWWVVVAALSCHCGLPLRRTSAMI